MKNIKYFSLIAVILSSTGVSANNKFDLIIETGAVWQTRNDTQIPPDSGTRFKINEFNDGPFTHSRIEAYYRLEDQHALRFVYAPFDIEVTGRADKTVVFNGQSFSSAEDLTVNYKFNSYRVSYLYGFNGFADNQINIGFTGKIRDAKTTFTQGEVSSSYSNVGFVPLLYFEYQTSLDPNWHVNLTLDAAAAPQGRAIDAALKFRRKLGENVSAGLGFRTLEGGADNDKVYTFSWFNYALLDLKVGF